MNSKKLSNLFFLCSILFFVISCETNDELMVSLQQISVEGEGSTTKVEINETDWYIAEVVNNNGNQRIFGNAYSPDGNLLTENSVLEMKGDGRIESKWGDKGFVITRNTYNSLTVEVLENSTGEPFNFSIFIQGKNKTKEIIVRQKISQGYSFGDIKYFIQDEDKDSLFYRKGGTYQFNITTPVPFTFSPYSGVDIFRQSYFESDNPDAFVWLRNDSVQVNVPQTIYDGKIYFSSRKSVYGVITKDDYMNENTFMETLNLPAGKSAFHVEQEWQKRVVSYRLTLINNRIKTEKTVEGKWIEITPTGNFKIVNE